MNKLLSLIFLTLFNLSTILQPSTDIYSPKKEITENRINMFSPKEKSDSITEWNFMVYITSNNDLYPFSELNIKQMEKVGSNKNVNILVQQDVYGKAKSKRLFIKKNKSKLIEKITEQPESISGTPESLYSFAKWCINNYPAKKHALILWDHGSGILDPTIWKELTKFNPMTLYVLNHETGLFEINRTKLNKRGICFNEIFETYLTNQHLGDTLAKISKELLKGKKIDIVGMDACNMSMLEVGSQIKKSVKIMVGSEETEPGTGWNYQDVLKPLKKQKLSSIEFANNIVDAYQKHYEKSYTDFTQSAVNLEMLSPLEETISNISEKLISLLQSEKKEDFFKSLRKIRRKRKYSTIFANRDYIDLNHFIASIKELTENYMKNENYIKHHEDLKTLLIEIDSGLKIIEEIVTRKTFCFSIPMASGLSFYFPTRKIHNSYSKTDFAINTKWEDFLKTYLSFYIDQYKKTS